MKKLLTFAAVAAFTVVSFGCAGSTSTATKSGSTTVKTPAGKMESTVKKEETPAGKMETKTEKTDKMGDEGKKTETKTETKTEKK
jgi:hypothetical protein